MLKPAKHIINNEIVKRHQYRMPAKEGVKKMWHHLWRKNIAKANEETSVVMSRREQRRNIRQQYQ